MGTKVLLPVDGSEATMIAMDQGLKLLGSGLDVTVFVVMDAKILAMPKPMREHLEWDDEDEIFLRPDEAKAVVQKTVDRIGDREGVKIGHKIVKGKVFEAIVAESKHYDVMIMHSLREKRIKDSMHRSMTERLARRAQCDVLLMRDGITK